MFLGFVNLQGLSPPEVIEGYEKACKKALDILPGKSLKNMRRFARKH